MAIENPLRLTSLEDNNVIALTQTGTPSTVSLEYRTDINQEWQPYAIGDQLTLQNGSWVELRNTTGTFSTGVSDYYTLTITRRTSASGNVNSLLDWTKDNPPLKNYCYCRLFKNCISLTQAPELPATKLASGCYISMFYMCTSLVQAPKLPATTLDSSCYNSMFQGCTSLTQAPELSATKLASGCYSLMFSGCSKIDHILWKSRTIPLSTYCNGWLGGVSASGTFEYTWPLLDVASIARTTSGVPEGWNMQQLKPQAGIALKINNVDVKKATLFSKNISKLFINGVKVKSSSAIGTDIELPSQYTKLQYVSSNGGTLDTGIPTNGNLKVGIKWSKPTSGNSTWPEIFGNSTIGGFSGEYYQAFTFRHNEYSDSKFKYEFYHGLYSPTEQRYGAIVPYQPKIPLDDTIHEFWLGPTEFSFDGNVYNNVDYANQYEGKYNDWEYRPSGINKSNMFLFTSKTGNREAKVNCYNFYIIDTTTNDVLLNYVPCQIGAQAGFFDTVLQTFVTHASFVAGPVA